MMEIETGTVVYWRQFRPVNYDGEIKPVYMLCLGRDPMTCDAIFTYISSPFYYPEGRWEIYDSF